MKKKSSKQRLQETMIKTIIKQVLAEMDVRSLFRYHRSGTEDRALAAIFPKANPEALKRLKVIISGSDPEKELIKAGFSPKRASEILSDIEKAHTEESEKLMGLLGSIQGELKGGEKPSITPAARSPEERVKLAKGLGSKPSSN